MSYRRMTRVPHDDLRDLARLAAAAVQMHDRQTHYGTCDVCELVQAWRHRLPTDIDTTGLRSAKVRP